MADSIIRGLAYDGNLRVSAVVATDITEELRKRHDTWPGGDGGFGTSIKRHAFTFMGLKRRGYGDDAHFRRRTFGRYHRDS